MFGVIAATGVTLGAATFIGLHSMLPTSQLFGASFNGLPPGTRKLALTYDDGPNDRCTQYLLDVLARHDVKATFFMLGRFVEQSPALARRVAESGHVIGNHSYDHPRLIWRTDSQTRWQIERTQKAIQDATGTTPTLFRPGYGGRRPGTFAIAREYNLSPVMWRVICGDWNASSSAAIERRAVRKIKGGEVIVLHDGAHRHMGGDRRFTVEATDHLIRRYKESGYDFVTVPEMMKG